MTDRYLIPAGRTRIEFKVSNSRFIATVDRASSAKEAHAFVRSIREEMPDATHHVYAFRIGHGASISEGMSDDGEPSGTAGPPAMAVLRGSDVGDVVLVITRYFGGTKLGTGGLVTSYSEAAKRAFAALQTEEKVLRDALSLAVPYPLRDPLHRLMAQFDMIIDGEDFTEVVHLNVRVAREEVARFTQAVEDLSAGQVKPQPLDDSA